MKVTVHGAKSGKALYQRWSITYRLRGDPWYWHYTAVLPLGPAPKEQKGHVRIGDLDLEVRRLADWKITRTGFPFSGTAIGGGADDAKA